MISAALSKKEKKSNSVSEVLTANLELLLEK